MESNIKEPQKKKYKRLLTNTFVLGIGVFASKFLVFLMMPFYTGILSPEEYGTADLISQTANLLIPLACVGITDGVFRFAMDRNRDKRAVLSSGLCVLAISSAAFALLSPLIGLIPYFEDYVVLIFLYVLAANVHSLCAQYMRACGRTAAFALQGIINTALVIILNIIFLAVFNMGITGYVLSVIIADAAVSILLVFPFKLYKSIGFGHIEKPLIKQLLKYSIPMIPATVFWWITSVSDRYMVTYFCGAAENGLYTAAYKIPTLLTLVSTVFMEAWQYSAVAEGSSEDSEERVSFFSEVFKYYGAFIFTACSLIIGMSQVLVFLLCAESYSEAWRFVPILTLSAVFSGLTSFFGSVYLLRRKSSLTFITSMAGAAINIVLNLILIPIIEAQGASIATFASYFSVFFIRAINTKKYLRFKLHVKRTVINVSVITVQIILMLTMPKHIWITQSLCCLVIVLINILPMVKALKNALRNIIKKRKKE